MDLALLPPGLAVLLGGLAAGGSARRVRVDPAARRAWAALTLAGLLALAAGALQVAALLVAPLPLPAEVPTVLPAAAGAAVGAGALGLTWAGSRPRPGRRAVDVTLVVSASAVAALGPLLPALPAAVALLLLAGEGRSAALAVRALPDRWSRALAPGAVALLLLGGDAAVLLLGGTLPAEQLWATLGVAGLLVGRQALLVREDAAALRDLERRVTERTAAGAARERWFRSLVQNLSDVIAVVDGEGRLTYQTPSARERLGLDPEALAGRELSAWWLPSDAVRLRRAFRDLSGRPGTSTVVTGQVRAGDRTTDVEAVVTALADASAVTGFVLTLRDVTERRRLEAELAHQAFHDPLTGLANRALFRASVEQALARAGRGTTRVVVLFLDLDGFKAVNDTLGHGAGDQLLVSVAARLTGVLRAGAPVARLGGDEFAVLLEDPRAEEEALSVAARLQEALLPPITVDGRSCAVRSSCGIAHGSGAADVEELLRNADLAMYRAKGLGHGGAEVYEPGLHDALVARVALEADLRGVVDRGELEVWYQPTVRLGDGRWTGVEALVRWRSPGRGLVSPPEFIGVAEETGTIRQIGAWVLREACAQTAAWRASDPALAGLTVAVNVSGRQLDLDFPGLVRRVLAETGLPASALVLELTEGVLLENTAGVLTLLTALRATGVRLAVDDFGTGYSSLSYLHRFPVDILKIDRSFVGGLGTGDGGEHELARTIIRLGQGLGLTTVAEGVEEPHQLAALRSMGCATGQGHLFGEAVPAHVLSGRVPSLLAAPTDASGTVPDQRPPLELVRPA